MTHEDNADAPPLPGRGRGELSYLQIPAVDVTQSASFYNAIFGWHVNPPDSVFSAPGLLGHWVTDRPPSRPDAGPLLWLNVENLEAAVQSVFSHGGEIIVPASINGRRQLATITDPAGNVLGIVQHGPSQPPAAATLAGAVDVPAAPEE